MLRQIKTLGSGASSIRAPGITPLNVSQSNHWWPRWKHLNLSQNQKKVDKSLTQNPFPLLLPPRSIPVNLMNQRKASVSFIHRCGWGVLHYTSSVIVVSRRTSSQRRSSNGYIFQQNYTHSCTPLDGSANGAIFMSANSVTYPTASSPSNMRYCVMSPPLKFLMLFWANLIYGNVMLYMSLGLVVLLLLWIGNCIRYSR